jgi:hypothetical protein
MNTDLWRLAAAVFGFVALVILVGLAASAYVAVVP